MKQWQVTKLCSGYWLSCLDGPSMCEFWLQKPVNLLDSFH